MWQLAAGLLGGVMSNRAAKKAATGTAIDTNGYSYT